MNEEFEVKDSLIETPIHIGAYTMPDKICDDLISYFNINERVCNEGMTYSDMNGVRVDKDTKDSLELKIGIEEVHFPIWDYRQYLQKCLEKYMLKYKEVNFLSKFKVGEDYQIQKYPKGGGFKKWHFERGGPSDITRHLVFMTYLNDVEDGGTDFKYQNFTCPAKKGLTLIWPADWTFTHKGQVSHTCEKIIITGWWNAEMNNE